MKYTYITSLLCFLAGMLYAQPKEIPLNSNTVFKDINGKQISFETFIQWTSGGVHEIAPSFDVDGNLLEVFVLEASIAPPSNPVSIDTEMPEFEVSDIHGQVYNPSILTNKVVVLKFWFAACKPCVDEIPQLNKVVEHFRDHPDVLFLAPSLDKAERITSFLQQHPFTYRILPESRMLADQFHVFGYPTHYVINRQGKVQAMFTGVNHNIDQKLISSIDEALLVHDDISPNANIPTPPLPEEIIITPNSIIKDELGTIVSFEDFSQKMRENRYELQNAVDESGQAYILMSPVKKRD